MTTFKYNTRIIALIFLVLAISACSDDEEEWPPAPIPAHPCLRNDTITISNIIDIPQGVTFNTVRAEIAGVEWSIINHIEAAYSGGKVILELPSEIPTDKLCKGAREKWDDLVGFWPAKTDNKNARVAMLGDLFAYNNDVRVGRIYLTDLQDETRGQTTGYVYYHYSDQPFTLSGYNHTLKDGDRKSFKYEASFEKGWNAYVNIKYEAGDNAPPTLCTTTFPDDMILRWRFESYVY